MNKKQRTERILIRIVAAILVLYGIYQVAYGQSVSDYLNGTMTETFDNGTTKVYQKGSPEYNATHTGHWFDPSNSTWTMYNSTSGSVSKITFYSWWMAGGFLHNQTFIRILNGHIHRGIYMGPYLRPGDDLKTLPSGNNFSLCEDIHRNYIWYGIRYHILDVCAILHPIILNSDHMEFKDQHGGTIRLVRNVML